MAVLALVLDLWCRGWRLDDGKRHARATPGD